MTPKPRSKKVKKITNCDQRKKITVPEELRVEIINDTLADSMDDTVTIEPTPADIAFIEDVSDSGDMRTRIRERRTNRRRQESPVHGSGSDADSDGEAGAAASYVDTSKQSKVASVVTKVVPPSESAAKSVEAPATKSTSASSTSSGAIPKQKPVLRAPKTYEFPQDKPSWYEETQRSESTERDNPFSRPLHQSQLSIDSAKAIKRVEFMPPKAPAIATSDQRPVDPIDYQRRNPMADPNAFGEGAYFLGGNYRKPDKRTIYIDSIERLFQKTLNDNFVSLPSQTLEYHIKSAEKLWYQGIPK